MAQKIKPVVYIGKSGVGSGVTESLREALEHHELVKVKFIDFKPERETLAGELAAQTESTIVQIIGNVAVFYKEQDDPEKKKYALPKRG